MATSVLWQGPLACTLCVDEVIRDRGSFGKRSRRGTCHQKDPGWTRGLGLPALHWLEEEFCHWW